jgi:hypothetical protein
MLLKQVQTSSAFAHHSMFIVEGVGRTPKVIEATKQ